MTIFDGIQNNSGSLATFSQSVWEANQGIGWQFLAADANASAYVAYLPWAASEPGYPSTWKITTTKGQNTMTTSAGIFDIWDNGNWQIMCQSQAAGSKPYILATVKGVSPNITVEVNADGTLSGILGMPN